MLSRMKSSDAFFWIVKAQAAQKITGMNAAAWAERNGAPKPVVDMLRAGQVPGMTPSSNWAGDLLGPAGAPTALAGFTESLANDSAFFRMLNAGAFGSVPPFCNIGITTTAANPAAQTIAALSRGEWPAEQIVNPQVRAKFRW